MGGETKAGIGEEIGRYGDAELGWIREQWHTDKAEEEQERPTGWKCLRRRAYCLLFHFFKTNFKDASIQVSIDSFFTYLKACLISFHCITSLPLTMSFSLFLL